MSTISDIRREARRRRLDWPAVRAAFEEIWEAEHAKRERPNEVREAAWIMATASVPGCWPFWRHGFASRWGRKVDLHDYTAVPGYDEIGQQIGTLFGEYADDDGTERLFELLMSPYDRLPERAEIYQRALETVEAQDNAIPF